MTLFKRIGIDQLSGDIYESIGSHWRTILPPPMLSDTIMEPTLPVEFAIPIQGSRCIFREDDFNSVARIRRGRFYEIANSQQPLEQWSLPHPGEYYNNPKRGDGLYRKTLTIYDQYQLGSNIEPPKLVALGSAESLWQVIYKPERISTGELLFTLRARHAFGILPELERASIPEEGRDKVIETLEKLKDAAYRESPASVIDRARDAAQWCLATWAASNSEDPLLLHEDLGPLIKRLRELKSGSTKAAEVVRILHSRVKPQRTREIRISSSHGR